MSGIAGDKRSEGLSRHQRLHHSLRACQRALRSRAVDFGCGRRRTYLRRDERVTSDFKEVVVRARRVNAQNFRPDSGQHFSRRIGGSREVLSLVFQLDCVKCLAIDFAIGGQRQMEFRGGEGVEIIAEVGGDEGAGDLAFSEILAIAGEADSFPVGDVAGDFAGGEELGGGTAPNVFIGHTFESKLKFVVTEFEKFEGLV